jgi:hypothetical protein
VPLQRRYCATHVPRARRLFLKQFRIFRPPVNLYFAGSLPFLFALQVGAVPRSVFLRSARAAPSPRKCGAIFCD